MDTLEVPIDLGLQAFLSHFNYDKVTVSIQPEKGKPYTSLAQGNWFSPTTLIRAIPSKDFFKPRIQEELRECNTRNHAVFFTINEGNGVAVDKTLNCGKTENIIKLKTLCIDTDNANIEEVYKKLKEIRTLPHLEVNSSPNRYHLYFLLKDEEVTSENRRKWESIQRLLCSLCEGIDKSTAKVTQQLRLPGFEHQKGKPFRVALTKDNTAAIPRYDLSELYTRLGAYKFDTDQQYTNGELKEVSFTKYEYPKQKIKEGGRHVELLRYCNHLMENKFQVNAEDKLYRDALEIHAKEFCDNYQEFLPSGGRSGEINKIIKDARKKRVRQEHALMNAKYEEVEVKKDEPLPDSFYLNFPGDLGVLTRFIHDTHSNLSLELCFAGALCFSGVLKGDLLRFKEAWPYVNGFVLAPTGTGKSTLINMIEQLAREAGIAGNYSQILSHPISVQALHYDLYKAGGTGALVIDEAGDYIQSLSLKSVSGFSKMIRPYLKNATSSPGRLGRKLEPGRSKSNTDPSIVGLLSVWMFSQPSMFYSSIDLHSMSDGFIPRFFIFKGDSKHDFTSYVEGRSKGLVEIPADVKAIIDGLNSLRNKIDHEGIDKEIAKSLEGKKGKDLKNKEDLKIAKLYELKSVARLMDMKNVEITEEAQSFLIKYLEREAKDLDIWKKEKGEGTAEEDLMARTEEMVLRLICNAASWDGKKALVDLDLVHHCVKFYSFQRKRFLDGEAGELYKSWAEKQADIIYNAVVRAFDKYKTPCTIGQIIPLIKAGKRPDNADKLLNYLETVGKVWSLVRKHKHTGKDVKVYRPAGVKIGDVNPSEVIEVDKMNLVN